MSEKIDKTDADWRAELSPEQYKICRQCGTEPAFTGEYWNKHDAGIYQCACCGNPTGSRCRPTPSLPAATANMA
jgi:peptide-methionine (R)-S-oxide reductase